MRAFSTILASASIVATALAGSACMSDADAAQVANNFATLQSAYSDDLANAALTADFTDYSDSVIEIINGGCNGPVPLGSAAFSDRATFETAQAAQPPSPFDILNTWHNCDTVFLRWRTTVAPGAPEIVTGLIAIEAVEAPSGSSQPWLIETVYSEFNSGAFLVDLGIFTPTCSASKRSVYASHFKA